MFDLESAREILKADPGNPLFPEYADELRKRGQPREAIEACLTGLSANPASLRGRLVLARVYYESGYLPFALRELDLLNAARPESESLRKLRERLSPGVANAALLASEGGQLPGSMAEISRSEAKQPVSETIAEAEFDLDVLQALQDEKNNEK